MGLDGTLDGHELSRPPLELMDDDPVEEDRIRITGRVGVNKAADWPLRFLVADSESVSDGRGVVDPPRTRAPDGMAT